MSGQVKSAEMEIVAAPSTRCPVGLGTSGSILRVSPWLFVVSRIFAVTYAVFGYFWVIIALFATFVGQFWSFLDLF